MIFERFTQVGQIKSENIKSTGLGLTFCKLAVEAHSGIIKAINNKSGGAVFMFSLPLSLDEHKSKKQNRQNQNIEKKIIDEKLKILETLETYKEKLRKIPVFEASEIIKELYMHNDKQKAVINWKNKIKSAVFAGNTEYYNKLIDS